MNNRLIKSNDAGGGGGCTNTVDLYNPFPDGGGVALYQLNGDATDVSGNYDGTATNVTYGAGQFGQAGVFNGSSSQITFPYLSGITPTSNISASLWINGNAQGNADNVILSLWDNSNLELRVDNISPSVNRIMIIYRTTSYGSIDSTFTMDVGVWTHLAFTYSYGIGFIVYKNGISSGLLPFTGTLGTLAGTNKIGAFGLNNSQYFNGSIDQVRIFSRALRPYEVEALYTEEYCTPTIVPSEHFNTVTYTGNGGTLPITDVGFQPDFTWIKSKAVENHVLTDSVRGVNSQLFSNLTNAESTLTTRIQSFDSTGFTVGSSGAINNSGTDYVSWNFKAGGAAVTNTDGTITSQVSANTEAGFSVVKFTGNTISGATIGHGLGDIPTIIIAKSLGGGTNWCTQFPSVIGAGNSLFLNSTVAVQNHGTGQSNRWTQTLPTSSVFSIGSSTELNDNGVSVVAYCFAEVEGFSNFGSYVGTGASGNTVVTGFEPAFVMIKGTSLASQWNILDNKRDTTNPATHRLFANLSNAEATGINALSFLENGFEINNSDAGFNGSGQSYIYMAFAADPTAVEPTLEDSFNTVTWTGNNGTQSITGVGFQPDFVWAKSRTLTTAHNVFDSIRGATKYISSNLTDAESTVPNSLQSFNSDGFTVGSNPGLNWSSNNYVAWAWKGAELPAINSNGSITSVVSANPAAGFSIVSWATTSAAAWNVGHGLGTAPSVIISKLRNSSGNWWEVYHSSLGTGKYLALQRTNAAYIYADAFSSVTDTTWTSYTSNTVGPYIAYCFAEIAGFSKFGSYVGTGNTNGPTVSTGFEVAFLLVKKATGAADDWFIFDNKRTPVGEAYIRPNSSSQELDYGGDFMRIDATDGFQPIWGSPAINASGETYIYMAFANQF